MSKYHDDRTAASDPVNIRLSNSKLQLLQPDLFGWQSLFTKMVFMNRRLRARGIRAMLNEHLSFGDSRAAVVMRIRSPLIVAAYSDELDAVILLEFPDFLATDYSLRLGSRLLTVNTYRFGNSPLRDIHAGPEFKGRYSSFYPLIAEFLSDDIDTINRRKSRIAEAEWRQTVEFSRKLLAGDQVWLRDGRPMESFKVGRRVELPPTG